MRVVNQVSGIVKARSALKDERDEEREEGKQEGRKEERYGGWRRGRKE